MFVSFFIWSKGTLVKLPLPTLWGYVSKTIILTYMPECTIMGGLLTRLVFGEYNMREVAIKDWIYIQGEYVLDGLFE